ncbi:MAG: F0F1 ATP synthase subunit delta [Pseudomonadota bacterium]|nr:F0F1 ATP synthase subunit delta [Pseudomonadota bacterium]
MELDPLTIILEIINFLALLWILQRFLFKPIRNALARRQEQQAQALQEAESREQKAAELEQRLQTELTQWEQNAARRQQELQTQLQQEKAKILTRVQEAAAAEKTRLESLRQQDAAQLQQQLRQQASATAAQLTTTMLRRLAGPELDHALARILLEDLRQLTATELQELKQVAASDHKPLVITVAHSANDGLKQTLEGGLNNLLGPSLQPQYRTDPDLISGLRIKIGSRLLHANLADELKHFTTESADDAR